MRGKRKEERGYKVVGYELSRKRRVRKTTETTLSSTTSQYKQTDIFKSLWDESIVGNTE
jgi:hypothetical protein